ncbi:murein biosynthesis integral membrane protein MurJ [Jatrophihabitans fulvus]
MTHHDGGDWSAPTIYHARQYVEPRTFTEADPIGSLFVEDLEPGAASPRSRRGDTVVAELPGGGADAGVWGSTTLVGKPRRERKKNAAATPPVDEAATPSTTRVAPELDSPTSAAPGTTAGPDPDAAPAEAPAEPSEDTSNRRLLAASGSMAVATLVSRLTGFLRTIFIVAALGVGGVGNAYNSANTYPNQVYELLLGGVLSSVLIPLLVHAQTEDEDEGVAYTQRLLSIAAVAMGVMTILAVIAAPWISAVFVDAGPQRDLTTIFATLLLPEIFFYGLGAMFIAVLNIRHSYKAGAWSPVLNNMIMIVTVVVFWLLPGPATLNPSTITTPQIVVLGVGTTLGIAAQAFVLVPSLRKVGFRWQWRFRAQPNEVGRLREVGVLGGWVLGYVAVSQLGVSVIQKVGNSNGGYTVFTNVDLLFQMPYGILVVSLLTAIMPRLSRAAIREDNEAVVADLGLGARLSAIGMLPITAGLIALAPAMAVTLFSYGASSAEGGRLIGTALAWSAFGLFPFALVMLQLRVFYAMRDGKTPTIINVFMVAAKVVLVLVSSAAFDGDRAIEWLNISTSLSYVVGAIVGHIVLTRRLGRLGFTAVARTAVQIGIASVAGGLAAYGVVRLAESALGEGRTGAVTGLIGGSVVGLVVLAVVAWRLRIPAVQQAIATVRGR